MNTQAETWLFLEDSPVDRSQMDMAVRDLNRGIRLLQASSLHEAKDLLAKYPVSVFLTDFYLRNGLNTSKLIAEVRATSPRLPIVVVTGQTHNQDAPYAAGADSVIPKMEAIIEYSKSISAAVSHARHQRSIEQREIHSARVYVPKCLTEQFLLVSRRQSGNILIASEAGMGRSSFARHLAKLITEQSPVSTAAGVHVLKCSSQNYSRSDFEQLLYGSASPRCV